jgi:hypothetical protein
MNRREFITGAAVVAVTASLPPVAPPLEPVRGLKWQTWPWDKERPLTDYARGSWISKEPEQYAALLQRFLKRYEGFPQPLFIRPIA